MSALAGEWTPIDSIAVRPYKVNSEEGIQITWAGISARQVCLSPNDFIGDCFRREASIGGRSLLWSQLLVMGLSKVLSPND